MFTQHRDLCVSTTGTQHRCVPVVDTQRSQCCVPVVNCTFKTSSGSTYFHMSEQRFVVEAQESAAFTANEVGQITGVRVLEMLLKLLGVVRLVVTLEALELGQVFLARTQTCEMRRHKRTSSVRVRETFSQITGNSTVLPMIHGYMYNMTVLPISSI